MKVYMFKLCFCDGRWVIGTYDVIANSEEEAEEKLVTEVGSKLYNAFPMLDIEYSWELQSVEKI